MYFFTGHTLLNLHYPAAVDVERCGNQGEEARNGRKRPARHGELVGLRGDKRRPWLQLATNSQQSYQQR